MDTYRNLSHDKIDALHHLLKLLRRLRVCGFARTVISSHNDDYFDLYHSYNVDSITIIDDKYTTSDDILDRALRNHLF
jgi:hypothetical protein